ncbi:carbohydrate ABC transporter permease [Psychromicrobium xiongbiense]|uniref:carbohydrate ABC transporter permease n=1 Tax=Psychromicrobium xiongbiense TaxID=3051184 RepID=UPI00255479AC|nr:carbohydrate ABC transporter permease [Psychromicrobium sp. YIM S02556]
MSTRTMATGSDGGGEVRARRTLPSTARSLRPAARGRSVGRRPRPAAVLGRGARLLVAIVVGLLFLLPIGWMVLTSVSSDADVFQFPPRLWPAWDLSHYVSAWKASPWLMYFGNTVFIAACVIVLVLVTSLLAGFAFAVMRFRGRSALFLVVMSVMMVPQTVLLIPNFLIAQQIGWYDTYLIQIVPWGASVFGIFLIRQFFSTLPTELFEAAEIDGAGPFRMLFSVAAPLAAPSLVLVGLNSFMGTWNSFVWPYIMTKSDSVRPIEVGLQAFYGADGTDWTSLCAAVSFTTLPVIVVFLFLQKYFVNGAYGTQGSVRG